MSRYVFKLPDLGEGTVSSEIVAWRVQAGQTVREDDPLVEMSTDKAVVEVPAPVSGKIVSLGGKPGDVVSVGAELVVIETEAQVPAAKAAESAAAAPPASATRSEAPAAVNRSGADETDSPARVKASPSTRRRAKVAGIDLTTVQGSGPGGRIMRADLDRALERGSVAETPAPRVESRAVPAPTAEILDEVPVIGVRKVIAQRMAEAKRTIPHFSYVEEVDITELEELRAYLNGKRDPKKEPALTYLPFLVLAMTRTIAQFPQINARHDSERNTVVRFRAVHVGVATQTADGLKVPVVRRAEALSLRELAAEIARVADLARNNRARREDLTGSTITVTSLGKLGGIATTPVINSPEVAIVGVNRAVERPVVRNGRIVVRRMMNLSSSFDHRFVDGFDAAAFIQALKERLEHPALIFAPASL